MARRRRKSRKWISGFLFLILVIVAAVICYLVWDNYFRDDKPQETQETEQITEKKPDDEVVQGDDKNSNEDGDDKKVIQYEGEDPNTQDELSGSVTYAGKLNENISVRVNIDQFLNEGSCKLSILSNSETIYEENAQVVSSASTSTCDGFDFSSSAFAPGNYNIIIRIISGEKSGSIKGTLEI